MRHQQILLELATRKATHPQELDRLRQPRRKRRFPRKASLTHPGKKYYKATRTASGVAQRSKFVGDRLPRRKRRRRQASWKKLVILAPTIIPILLILNWLISILSNSFPVFNLQQFENPPQKVAVSPPQISPVDALVRAIIEQESTNNFQSLNPHSQALGLAQVMPANLSDWSKEALGYHLTAKEFLNNPELQKKIINHKLSEYWQDALTDTNGDEDLAILMVASRWYSGSADNYNSKAPQWYKAKDGKLHRYPSIAEYSNSILEKYRQFITPQQ